MRRYTNIDALIEAMGEEPLVWNEGADEIAERNQWLIDMHIIESAPSIDIVFCKECKHRPVKEDADGEDFGFNIIAPERSSRCPCLVDDGWYSWMPKDNFFCGYGEIRDE